MSAGHDLEFQHALGGGGAGLTASITAAQNGAKVILVEKAGSLGGNTLIAGQGFNACDPERQANTEMSEALLGQLKSYLDLDPADFGAFAEVLPGVDGLIHISQIANRRIGKPDEVLTVGDIVDAKITAIDEEKHKISLSIRALTAPEPAPVRERPAQKPMAPEADALVYEISATGEATGNIPEIDFDDVDE